MRSVEEKNGSLFTGFKFVVRVQHAPLREGDDMMQPREVEEQSLGGLLRDRLRRLSTRGKGHERNCAHFIEVYQDGGLVAIFDVGGGEC